MSKVYFLHESLIISEYLDSFPGPFLYPVLSDQNKNPIEKAVMDVQIMKVVEPLRKQIGIMYYKKNLKNEDLDGFKQVVNRVEEEVPDGKYFIFKSLNRNEISFVDLMALPLIERILAFKDQDLQFYEGLKLDNLQNWFQNMTKHSFVREHLMIGSRFVNLRLHIQAGTYHGLVLPLEYYDSAKGC